MNKRGYTLLELVVVLGILGIMLAVVTIQIGAFQKNEVEEMLSDYRFARAYAVSNQTAVHIHYDLESDSYKIVAGDQTLHTRTLNDIDLLQMHHIENPVVIYRTGAFSKAGSMDITYKGKPSKITFTVGIARFNERER